MKKSSDPYSVMARFYDQIIGERTDIPYVEYLISKYHPEAHTLLDMACGTATALNYLSTEYEVTGIDQSAKMLQVAKSRIAHAKFKKADMRSFSLKNSFDVVTCLLDSINHILLFKEWEQVFKNAYKHLNDNGVFIFDMNTERKFESHMERSPLVQELSNGVCIFDVKRLKKSTIHLYIQIFEHQQKDLYKKYDFSLEQRAFDIEKVKSGLAKYFPKVLIMDPERTTISPKSETIYFVCFK